MDPDQFLGLMVDRFSRTRSPSKKDEFSSTLEVMETLRSRYHWLEKVGEGTYGCVYKAVDKATGNTVALKKTLLDVPGGVPQSSLREILTMRDLSHPNIARLRCVHATPSHIYMVFDFVEYDLRRVMEKLPRRQGLPLPVVKLFLWQLLEACRFMHINHRIYHRDMKPPNILVTESGEFCLVTESGEFFLVTESGVVQLTDFGLARSCPSPPTHAMTVEVVTLWYRPPEILLRTEIYDHAVDIWSLACIFFEMVMGEVLYPGDSEIDQIFKIFRCRGTPTEACWPGVSGLQGFQGAFPRWTSRPMMEKVAHPEAADLIEKMLVLAPAQRLPCSEALKHPFLSDCTQKGFMLEAKARLRRILNTRSHPSIPPCPMLPPSGTAEADSGIELMDMEEEHDRSRERLHLPASS
ncbi:unnamed protein product [Cyprideis torosa]|uniref:Uncharacterized protein n=1 Tax=Cyprideis torosa TaxID=163714 RepID=A0A7R8WE07_9CRUS|nr:unnamed protein product [Cyprideis torosa]CAG0889690.1 unnamed protein product [Cyprideis torosa]